MEVVRSVPGIRDAVARLRSGGGEVALVPTMGALHEGHLSLVDRALELADVVVASVFVNPLQFGEGEDLEAYPRDPEGDVALLEGRGVSVVFAPDRDEVYPDGEPVVTVDPGAMGSVLCGAFRSGHFRGVLTVVAKLFGIVGPDVAVFGRKDYQQLVLIRRMTADLDMPVRVASAPTIREEDGLALSSRNRYLGPEARAEAAGLYRSLVTVREAFRAGTLRSRELLGHFRAELARHPGFRLQYVEIVDPETLEAVEEAEEGSVIATAAHLDGARLIDNLVLE